MMSHILNGNKELFIVLHVISVLITLLWLIVIILSVDSIKSVHCVRDCNIAVIASSVSSLFPTKIISLAFLFHL